MFQLLQQPTVVNNPSVILNMLGNEIHSNASVGTSFSKPDNDPVGKRVDTLHVQDLLVFLRDIVLVDANSVNPQRSFIVRKS